MKRKSALGSLFIAIYHRLAREYQYGWYCKRYGSRADHVMPATGNVLLTYR